MITDPPYGINDSPLKGNRGATNDWHPPSTWDGFIDPEWPRLVSVTAPVIAWFGQWKKREEVAAEMRLPLRAEIVWAKDYHSAPPCPLAPRDERIWIFSVSRLQPLRFETSVWDEPAIPTWAHKWHKNEKPIYLMRRLVSWLPGKTILDPFMGSGTTGVACIRTGRQFIGIEIERRYVDIAIRRMERELAQARLPFAEPEPQPVQAALWQEK